ncbi:TIGR03757 family integrating conjugative element protein [Citrobacter amalonaticus]|uniref:TIGR03757 family integrating conjugative element protein n=1 Tax=Citrobacter amalonaticus TaxID=35703 RepID=UPI001A2727BD|nr:TIGR03757 family integrating conjugative element protein [Citrobacter amalonaticus]HDQ2813300.1 TIGR03757 family integrating conjugative element protein [Citrobacter amalonaticus]
MKIPFCCLAALFISVGASAGTVIYTDSSHAVAANPGPDVSVVELDAPERAQADIFGQLSADPVLAEQRARAVISSPNFRQQQQQLAEAYAGVTHAWSLGLEKYPAVVFDDVFVVYGTTDVNEAARQLAARKEKNR